MAQTLEYKGFAATLYKDECDGVFYGKLRNIRDLVMFEGYTVEEASTSFREAVDDYLADLESEGSVATEGAGSAD